MSATELHVEVWMRQAKGGYQYRGMVRCGYRYLYRGEWLRAKEDAAMDGNQAARKMAKRMRKSVRHK